MRLLHALLLIVLATPIAWSAPSETDAEEIEHLLSHLAISDCTFNRNGKWYSGLQAAEHLRGKYDYLLKKDLVTTAESFIERAASRSSVSGKPYLVRCGNTEPVESRAWFGAELERFRDMKRLTTGDTPCFCRSCCPSRKEDDRMPDRITPVDVSRHLFDIHRDLSVTTRAHRPGPPVRIDGITVGIITITEDAPHRGEVHPDGDEILYLVSGRLQVTGESEPNTPIELHAGQACIVRKGEWHRVHVLEKTQLVHITPGPHGDHRPL